MKWEPDLSLEEFCEVISPVPAGYIPHRSPTQGLQEGAWFQDEAGVLYVRIPWRKYTAPEGRKVFGQLIKAHDTHKLVMRHIYPTHNSILDVGGYDGIWAWLFAAERKVVLDICQEALERWAIVHADIICEDARNLGKLFEPDEFDVIFLLDVLEHMKATSALKCIKAAEKIAKYQVIVATPDGYQPFDDYESILTPDADVPCVELMAHYSGWSHEFFRDRGYKVIVQTNLHTDIGGGDGLVAFLNKWER